MSWRSVVLGGALAVVAMFSMPAGEGAARGLEALAQRLVACTREYRPVCGRTRTGRLRTFSNACLARRAGARIVYHRVCRRR
jgi:hypothetical protein